MGSLGRITYSFRAAKRDQNRRFDAIPENFYPQIAILPSPAMISALLDDSSDGLVRSNRGFYLAAPKEVDERLG
jgi:hypothetical protein